MKRTVIRIDEEKCTGCGICVDKCHENALQLIDGKAVVVSDLYCDGLGACLGDCPVDAIALEETEAVPYNETETMKRLVPKGAKVIMAHLNHLKDFGRNEWVREGIAYLRANAIPIDLSSFEANEQPVKPVQNSVQGHGCPGSKAMFFERPASGGEQISGSSELRQWPVQLHLLSPNAPYLRGCDLLLAADCTAFAAGNFHNGFFKGKRLAIACPKLDQGKEIYVEKLTAMINNSGINTLTVMIMEVPCCGGLLQIAETAVNRAGRKIPVKLIVIGLKGEVQEEHRV